MGESVGIIPSSNEPLNLVLLGRTGNGKSSTGNTILGGRAFTAKSGAGGVTRTCQSGQTVFDGQTINVIDTPGLFSPNDSKKIVKEIVKCIDMAKDGIHGILLVLSVRNRFSEEEEAAIRKFKVLFGSKLYDYMIVVFTGGDELDDNDETLDDYLSRDSPEHLKKILKLCEHRKVLFDNRTKDKGKKDGQVKELLSMVNNNMNKNGGKPYTNEFFIGLKGEKGRKNRYTEEDLKRIAEMVELKLKETTKELDQQLKEQRVTINNLGEDLARARRENQQPPVIILVSPRSRPPPSESSCAIM